MATKAKQSKPTATQSLHQTNPELAEETDAHYEAQEEAQVTAETADMGKPRLQAPVAPRVTSGTSPGVIVRIRELLAGGLYQKAPDALEAAVMHIEAVSTLKAHPQVGVYKAEVLDYLRGKIALRDAKAA